MRTAPSRKEGSTAKARRRSLPRVSWSPTAAGYSSSVRHIGDRLAERGAAVTGLDATALFLDLTRRDAASVAVDYVKGDMRPAALNG